MTKIDFKTRKNGYWEPHRWFQVQYHIVRYWAYTTHGKIANMREVGVLYSLLIGGYHEWKGGDWGHYSRIKHYSLSVE